MCYFLTEYKSNTIHMQKCLLIFSAWTKFYFSDKPVCAVPVIRNQGVTKQESAKVICEVEAYPPQVNFTWKFNGSSEGEALPLDSIENHGTISALNYTAAIEQDYGTLLCWATNSIGIQHKPCVIHLRPRTLISRKHAIQKMFIFLLIYNNLIVSRQTITKCVIDLNYCSSEPLNRHIARVTEILLEIIRVFLLYS